MWWGGFSEQDFDMLAAPVGLNPHVVGRFFRVTATANEKAAEAWS